jgi:hypothetical protein
MEYRKIGMMGSKGWNLDGASKTEIDPPPADRFSTPIFHYSIIPSFQWTSLSKISTLRVEIKA